MRKTVLIFVLSMIAPWLLCAQEICDNGIDDDGDGHIDLNDSDCQCNGIGVSSLIPNPSFEDTLCCPNNQGQLHCAVSWMQTSQATTDYFSTCGDYTSINGITPPPFPLPGNGSGYAGFYNYRRPSGFVYQEMLGVCLPTVMKADTVYQFNFFLARRSADADPLVVSIYGTPNCNDLPWSGYGCPVGIGSWILLKEDTIEFMDNSWHHISVQFSSPIDLYSLAIGGGCDAFLGNRYLENYYYIDQLTVANSSEFDRINILESGKWCAGNLQLHAQIDTTGGSWQWYRDGIALLGETADSLDLMVYGTQDVYTAVYRLGEDCVSVEHEVEVSFFQDILPKLASRPSCKNFFNGQAYMHSAPGDTATLSYKWRSATDTAILSETDSLMNVPPGDYCVQITVSAGCDTTLFFEIPEEDFRVSFELSDTLICIGDTIQLYNTSDTHFMAYHWTFDNGDTSTLPNPPLYVYPESGTYRVLLAGEGEICKDTAYQTILVDQPILPEFKIEPESVCAGQTVSFFPKADRRTIQLVWAMEEQLRIENTIQHRYQHAFEQAGTYPITLHAQFRACPDTSYTDSITVYPFPEVDLGGDSSICLDGAPVYLKNVREAPLDPHHYLWSTGDTTASLKVVHPGTYTLSVTTEPIGCTTTESIAITKDCYIDIPNAFTPNGDGHNDYFFPRQLLTEGVTRFHMQVFNRWGQVVFETTNLDGRGWDGRFNDKAQPTGVYLYRIETSFNNGHRERYEGNVTLIR